MNFFKFFSRSRTGERGDQFLCIDDNECIDGNNYCVDDAKGGICVNIDGSFTCTCKTGYIGDGNDYQKWMKFTQSNGGWLAPNYSPNHYSTPVSSSPNNFTGCVDINECETLGNVCHVTGYCQNLDGTYECRCPDERPYGDGRIGCFTLAEIQSVHGLSEPVSAVETSSATNQNAGSVIANQIKDTVVQIDLPIPPVAITTQASTVPTTKLTTTTTRARTTTTVTTTTTTPEEVLIAEFTSPIINNDFDCAGQGQVCDFFSCANDIEVHCFNNGNCGVFCQDGGAPIGIKSFQCISTGKKKKQGWTNSGRFSSESLILSHDKL